MKPFIVFALWAVVAWDVGAWAEAIIGIPSPVVVLAGVAVGALLAIEARRQIAARVASGTAQVAAPISPFEVPSALERAA